MRPAYKRRIAIYDLSDMDRERLRLLAKKDGRTLSRWICDCVRAEIRRRIPKEVDDV
jgi:hypothetical protein